MRTAPKRADKLEAGDVFFRSTATAGDAALRSRPKTVDDDPYECLGVELGPAQEKTLAGTSRTQPNDMRSVAVRFADSLGRERKITYGASQLIRVVRP